MSEKRLGSVPLRAPAPRAVRVRPVVVYGVGIGLAALLAFALIRGLSASPAAADRSDRQTPTTIVPAGELPESMRAVPSNYRELAAISQTIATPEPTLETAGKSTPEPRTGDTRVATPYQIRRRATSIDAQVRRAKRAQEKQEIWKATSRFKIGSPSTTTGIRLSNGGTSSWGDAPQTPHVPPTPYVLERGLQEPASPYQLYAGTLIPIAFVSGINSDLPGRLLAQVREHVYDTVTGRHLLIPQGTRVIGRYDAQVAYAANRVLVIWERLIFPDGSSLVLEDMPGLDTSGYAGAADKVNHHFGRLVAGVIFGSLIAAGADELATAPGFGGRVLGNAGTGFRDASRQITERNLNRQPTIEIRPGTRGNIFVGKDIVLKPYESKEQE